jgi:hypothetical protein
MPIHAILCSDRVEATEVGAALQQIGPAPVVAMRQITGREVVAGQVDSAEGTLDEYASVETGARLPGHTLESANSMTEQLTSGTNVDHGVLSTVQCRDTESVLPVCVAGHSCPLPHVIARDDEWVSQHSLSLIA